MAKIISMDVLPKKMQESISKRHDFLKSKREMLTLDDHKKRSRTYKKIEETLAHLEKNNKSSAPVID